MNARDTAPDDDPQPASAERPSRPASTRPPLRRDAAAHLAAAEVAVGRRVAIILAGTLAALLLQTVELTGRLLPLALHLVDLALVSAYLWQARRLGAIRRRRSLAPPLGPAERFALAGFAAVSGANVLLAASGSVLDWPRPILGGPLSVVGKVVVVASASRLWEGVALGARRRGWLTRLAPPHVVALAFAGAIFVGTLLLLLPESARPGTRISHLDALFTATSATCVTGLIVKDTPHDFSAFGHVVLVALMQAGGLGIMTFSAFFGLLLRRRSSLQARLIVRDAVERDPHAGFVQILVAVIKFVAVAEGIGVVLLLAYWVWEGRALGAAAFLAVFHSVSAFCNAGFSLFSDSFMGYVGSAYMNAVIGGLLILGGLGFPVVRDLVRLLRAWRQRRRYQPALQTRLVVAATAILLVAGYLGTLVLEGESVLAGRPDGERLLAAGFQSATTRTCGFNTVDIGRLAGSTLFLYTILMFVGASPASTGGGIKTTTLATLYVSALSILRGRERVQTAARALPESVRHRAMAVAALAAAFVVVWALLLSLATPAEPHFENVLFETVSAFGTVGLSTGVTSLLTAGGKCLVIVAMFVGRVGPLTVAAAIRPVRERGALAYPEEEVMVG